MDVSAIASALGRLVTALAGATGTILFDQVERRPPPDLASRFEGQSRHATIAAATALTRLFEAIATIDLAGNSPTFYAVRIGRMDGTERYTLRATSPRQAALLAASLEGGEMRTSRERELRNITEISLVLPKREWFFSKDRP